MSIDVVITWVDGQDEAHFIKQQAYFQSIGQKPDLMLLSERLHSSFELDFCIQSIFKFIPWIRNIYIVTDNQTPKLLDVYQGTEYAHRIKVVDHQILFEGHESALPTFNSLSIETMLWRIPDLSEQFIYFNDDCFLLTPLGPHDFFQHDRVVLRGKRKIQSQYAWWTQKSIAPHQHYQENSAKMVGYHYHYIEYPHIPFALNKQIFRDFFSKNRQHLMRNIQYPLRDLNQFQPIGLFIHLALRAKKAIWDNHLKGARLHVVDHSERKVNLKLQKIKRDCRYAFLCIQNLNQGSENIQQMLHAWLTQKME